VFTVYVHHLFFRHGLFGKMGEAAQGKKEAYLEVLL
jgi:hypothetical protein